MNIVFLWNVFSIPIQKSLTILKKGGWANHSYVLYDELWSLNQDKETCMSINNWHV